MFFTEDIYGICKKVWEWENQNHIPYEKRLTEWYGDLGMHVPLPGITDEQIRRRYKNISREATARTSPVRGPLCSYGTA